MIHTTDRVAGLLFVAFGLLLYFLVIPVQTEPAEANAFVAPATVPNGIAWLLVVLGVWLFIKPTVVTTEAWKNLPRAVLFLAVITGGVALMEWFGFVIVAPVLGITLVWLMGERRPVWIGLAVLVMPALIWLLIVPVLDRVLP